MDDAMLKNTISQLAEAIRELSNQVQELHQDSHGESERLEKFKAEDAPLDFILVTSGLISGKLSWIGNHSFGVRTNAGQDVILYKHAIAFIQKQAAESRIGGRDLTRNI